MGKRGMDSYEFERRLDDYERRRGRGDDRDDDIITDILLPVLAVAICVFLVWAGIGWVDDQLGWGIQDWLKGLFSGVFGAVGH